MYIYIYIYIYTYIYTYIQQGQWEEERKHGDLLKYIHTYIYTCIHTYIYTYMHICIHTYIHTYIHMYMYTYTYDRDSGKKSANTAIPSHIYLRNNTYTYGTIQRQWEEERKHGDLLTYRRTWMPTPKYLAWKARQDQAGI